METIEELLARSGETLCTVRGDSMLPLLRPGEDTVRVERLVGLPRKNDIVLYRRADGDLILHRAVRILRRGVLCCGDNQTKKEYVPARFLIGRALGYARDGAYTDFTDPVYLEYVAQRCRTTAGRRLYTTDSFAQEWRTLLGFLRAAGEGNPAPDVSPTVAYAKWLSLAARNGVLPVVFPLVRQDACPKDVYERMAVRAATPSDKNSRLADLYARYYGKTAGEKPDDDLCRTLFCAPLSSLSASFFRCLQRECVPRRPFWRRVFPPFRQLRREYPVLVSAPYLLPVVFVWRGIRFLISRLVSR